jgi:hypothetical protein
VRKDQPALRGQVRQGAHAVDDLHPVTLGILPPRNEEGEDPHERRAQLVGDVRDTAQPLQFRFERSTDVDLADR